MEKHAVTRFPVHELIKSRWSPRAFAADLPSWEELGSMLEAARWAPSSFNGQPNRWANFDGGLAMAQFILQAEALGWSAHIMAGFHRDKARETFGIPENFEPCVAFAVGRRGDPDTLPEDFPEQERQERERKPLEDIVFSGTWGKPADWLSS